MILLIHNGMEENFKNDLKLYRPEKPFSQRVSIEIFVTSIYIPDLEKNIIGELKNNRYIHSFRQVASLLVKPQEKHKNKKNNNNGITLLIREA